MDLRMRIKSPSYLCCAGVGKAEVPEPGPAALQRNLRMRMKSLSKLCCAGVGKAGVPVLRPAAGSAAAEPAHAH